MTTQLIVIRHGETDWNVDKRLQGQLDIDLNAHGRWQAQQLGQSLSQESLHAIYASDLHRAWDTAQALSQACGVEVIAAAGLRERSYGDFQGYTKDQVLARWPNEGYQWRARVPEAAPPGGGEALIDFYNRSVRTALHLAEQHPGQTIALITHGGVLDCLYRAATQTPLSVVRTWGIDNTCINRLAVEHGQLRLLTWGDADHLQTVTEF